MVSATGKTASQIRAGPGTVRARAGSRGPLADRSGGEVAEAAHVLARLGLVTSFGHVSARAGTAMLITPAADLATVTEASLVEVPLTATALPLPASAPAEAWAHLALYQARPDAAAIARAQPPSAFAAAAVTSELLPLHGQAAWLGESVPVHGCGPAAALCGPGRAGRPRPCPPARRCCCAGTARSPWATLPASR